jgi:hypothetical protein
MLTLTLLLLVLGALLASFGTAGFLLTWAAPDHDSLRYLQALAKTGRRLAAVGLALFVLHYHAGGIALLALIAVALAAAATYLTATTNTIVPTS